MVLTGAVSRVSCAAVRWASFRANRDAVGRKLIFTRCGFREEDLFSARRRILLSVGEYDQMMSVTAAVYDGRSANSLRVEFNGRQQEEI